MSFQRSFETKFIPDICIFLQPLVLILVTLIFLHQFVLQISCFATMENNLLSFSKLIQFLVWAEENKLDAILIVIMYHKVKKLMGSNVRFSFWSCSIMLHLFAYLQDEWLSCKILARQRVILQDLARFCQNLARSCKIAIRCRLRQIVIIFFAAVKLEVYLKSQF